MGKIRWLTILGCVCIPVVFIIGQVCFTSINSDFRIPFAAIGILLSIIIIGLGEILYHLKNGGKKDED